MKNLNRVGSILLLFIISILVFFTSQIPLMEGYNFIDPLIDTKCAKGYNKTTFDQLQLGITKSIVLKG